MTSLYSMTLLLGSIFQDGGQQYGGRLVTEGNRRIRLEEKERESGQYLL